MSLASNLWPEVTFGDIFDISSSKRVLERQWTSKGVPFYRAREIVKLARYGTVENDLFISEDLYSELSKKAGVPEPGDLMVSAVGTLGACYQVQVGDRFYFKDASVLRFHPSKAVCSRFIEHAFRTPQLVSQIEAGSGSTVGTLTISRANAMRIALPPLDEQRRIAAILDKADGLRRKRKRALELLDGLTQSIFLEMFGDPIANSRRADTAYLQDVVSAGRKITYGILKPGPDLRDGVPYVRVVDIKDSRIDVDGLKRTSTSIAKEYRRSTLRAGDLLISIRGHVGRMAITPIECEGANITQDTARLAIEGADTEFVKAQLETEAAQNWMARRTKGAAVKGINLGDLKLFPLMLPPLGDQREFARRVAGLQRKALAAAQQSRTLDLLFASLQHRAFSGQL